MSYSYYVKINTSHVREELTIAHTLIWQKSAHTSIHTLLSSAYVLNMGRRTLVNCSDHYAFPVDTSGTYTVICIHCTKNLKVTNKTQNYLSEHLKVCQIRFNLDYIEFFIFTHILCADRIHIHEHAYMPFVPLLDRMLLLSPSICFCKLPMQLQLTWVLLLLKV